MNLKLIIDQLKKESLEALKRNDKEKREIFNTILSDLRVDGKDPDDSVGLDRAFSVLESYKSQKKSDDMGVYFQVLDSILPMKFCPLSENHLKYLLRGIEE